MISHAEINFIFRIFTVIKIGLRLSYDRNIRYHSELVVDYPVPICLYINFLDWAMSEMSEKRCLFVQLPSEETVSLKGLDISTSGSQIIAKLELSGGIPADIFTLHYLGLQVEDTTLLNFGDNIYSGAILRLKIKEEFKSLHSELGRGSKVLSSIIDNYSAHKFKENPHKTTETTDRNHHSSDTDGLLPKSITDKATFDNRMFVSLFVAASKGNSKLCSKILQRGKPVSKQFQAI